MNDTAPVADALPSIGTPEAVRKGPGTSRGRLFRKYLLLILTLVTGALLASGAISLYFTYQETKAALASLQHEKAIAAAARIEQYVHQIEQQLAYASLPQLDASDVALRKLEFLKLLRQAPEVTEIAQVDADGREQILVSRLGMDSVNSGRDRSQEPAYRDAKPGKTWFGPVYFRKETEPYMTIAIRPAGARGAVTVADVNLKFIWDVVSRIRIGEKGKAYVVDDKGFLVADPDIGLVLRKTDLSNLAHVRAANSRRGADDLAMISTDLAGKQVLTSVAPIESLNWNVFVEQPVAEVYAKLDAAILRTVLLLLAGLVLSALGALALARGMVRPIRTLEEGAQRIGAGDLDQRIDVRTGDELEALAGQFNRMSSQLRESYAGLERKVEARTQELTNSLEQQTAISEILRVISSSPTDVRPVLQAVAERAAHLCDAPHARVILDDGGMLRPLAEYSVVPTPETQPVPLARTSFIGRSMIDRTTLHYADVAPIVDAEFPAARDNVRTLGCRAVLTVPLIREGGAYGGIFLFRSRPGLFSPDQVALVQTFARQAAIAIDNVRLFNETKEALEQQQASAEVLRVISGSVADTAPVFERIAQSCKRLFDVTGASINLVGADGRVHLAYYDGPNPEQLRTIFPGPLDPQSATGIAILERRAVHYGDTLTEPGVPEYTRRSGEATGVRSVVFAPMLWEGRGIGVIVVGRTGVRPFSDKEIALLKTFADQAVIAIQNARLFNETREALERQTAISEILRVIAATPGDVKPMLNAVAERALRLCDAAQATIVLTERDALRCVAAFGSTRTLNEGELMPLTRGSVAGRAIFDRAPFQVEDLAEASEHDLPVGLELQRRIGHRTALAVPLMRENRAIGAIQLWRMEKRNFSERQVALVKTFADQAAIAIENVRLFNETKEALERQTATAEVLKVISGSPTNLQPVFDSIAERAAVLSAARFVYVTTFDGELIHMRAAHGPGAEAHRSHYPMKPSMGTVAGRVVLTRGSIEIPDMLADPAYEQKDSVAKIGFRSAVGVPMLREGRIVGCIVVARVDAGSFAGKLVELLQTFADQAVIAIENARLFNETKEALEQQQASAEVLRVISSSVADTAPVFARIAQSCKRLFQGDVVRINLVGDDGLVHMGYYDGPNQEEFRRIFPAPLGAESSTGIAILERRVVHYPDIEHDADVPPYTLRTAAVTGAKSIVFAPMIWEGRGIGAIAVARPVVQAFSDKEIALLRTFADQAVIAIQNARLFNETKEALDQQTAIAEILRVISSSPTDVQPVFDTIASSTLRLCEASSALVFTYDGELLHLTASANLDAQAAGYWARSFPRPPSRDTATARAVLTGKVVMIPDVLQDPEYVVRDTALATGFRSALAVPLLRDGNPIGVIGVIRSEAGPYSGKEMALLQTFADQAVIAIENVRLFNQTKEGLEQQTAIAEILRVISGSPTDVLPVLDAIAEHAAKLCDASAASMYLIDGDALRHLASKGPSPDAVTHVDRLPINRETITGRAVLDRTTIQVPDLLAKGDEYPLSREIAQRHGHRTVVVTPLLREGQPFGAILLRRNDVRAFSEREIALLRTFGDQAAIALENVRLFNETKEALDQQRASGEVLAAISNSIADTAPVFEAILASCERLFTGKWSVIDVVGEDGLVHLGAYHGSRVDEIKEVYPHPPDETSATGIAIATREVVHYPRIDDVPRTARPAMEAFGIEAAIGAPMIWEGKGIGAVWVARDYAGPFSEKEIALLKTFAGQAAIAIQNARLFREIEEKSRQLEVANKHKSDFLANMSHELRTPLNAIIGFSEVLLEKLFGDINDKQDDYLKDIHSSGKHLLTLINDILDLSKIEAGRMELEPSSFDLANAISNALTLVRERAQRHGIALSQAVDPALGEIVADERKFKQILINLLTNAVKFTPDGGRIDVTARRMDRHAEIAVRDTGIGIAAQDQAVVFEEFRQVGRDYTNKQEGTGLGLALTRKFVELHGGTITLESAPGKGSTFTFTIPLHAAAPPREAPRDGANSVPGVNR